MNIKEFKEKQKELEEVAKTSGKTLLTEMFKDLFDNCPELEEVRWYQYTPYINDGEPCEFSVGDMGLKFSSTKNESDEDEEDFDEERVYDFVEEYGFWNAPKQYKEFCSVVAKSTGELEKLFLMAFDDHVEVSVKKDKKGKIKFEVTDFNHD